MSTITTCTRCYLTEKFPNIRFDTDGVCNYCRRAMSPEYQQDIRERFSRSNTEGLKKMAEQIRAETAGRKSKYDCVIGASGGFDSTYVVYVARKIMGLNPLVIKYDNGVCHEMSNENLKEACRRLGVELRIIPVIKNERDYMVYSTKSLQSLDVFFSACFSCHYILPSIVYKTARDENIGYTFSSTNNIEDEADKGSHGFKLKALFKGFFTSSPRQMLKTIYYQFLAQISFIKLKFQFDGFSWRFLRNLPTPYPVRPKYLKRLNVSEYIGWDYFAIMKILREELGWKSPMFAKVPLFRWDCYYGALTDKSCKNTVGIGAHSALCNWFVQVGLVSKEDVADAMKYLEDDNRIEEEIQKVYKEFHLQTD
jgi:hypothetical protein